MQKRLKKLPDSDRQKLSRCLSSQELEKDKDQVKGISSSFNVAAQGFHGRRNFFHRLDQITASHVKVGSNNDQSSRRVTLTHVEIKSDPLCYRICSVSLAFYPK